MKAHFILLLFLSLSIGDIYCQNERLYGAGEYGSEELSSNLITQMVQDTYGFIWVATEYGLNKFDGIRFIQYLHVENDNTSLLSNNVRALLIDKDSTLWVGCNKGLQYYLPKEQCFKTIKFPGGESPHIANIYQFLNGDIWVTTSGWGIFSIDKDTEAATYIENITTLVGAFSNYIYEDRQLNIWISMDDKGIMRINPSTNEHTHFHYPNIPHNNIIGIVEDHDDQLYIGTSTGVCFYEKSSGKLLKVDMDVPGISITDMLVTRKGLIYVATDGMNLKYIDKKNKKLLSINNERAVYNYSTAKINTIIEDRDQNLWLGCFLKGILMISNEQTQFNFQRIFDKKNQLGSTLTFILKDHEGYLWCGTNQEGIHKLDSIGKTVKHFAERTDITDIYEDSDNTLWVGSYHKGLGKMDRNTGRCTFLNIPRTGYIKTMVEGKDKCLYVSTFGYGCMIYDKETGSWKNFNMRQDDPVKGNLDNDWINTIICDSDSLIWFGHYKGVSCYDPNKKSFLKGAYSNELASQICISLMEDKDGDIWVGTYNGLFRISKKDQTIKRYTVDQGLSSNAICGLAQDKRGNIWCSTFKGINQLKLEEERIVNYYVGNGLVEKIYNRGVYFQEGRGTIYFGGNNGITSFYPFEIDTPSYNHEIITTNVYVNNQSINSNTLSGGKPIIKAELYNAGEFGFSYEDNTFTFEFSTMDFKSPENIFYEYRMKELDNNWNSTLPGISRITYNHLNPGKYTLYVRACKYGAYSSEKQFLLTIYPPWHKSTPAYFIYFFIILSIGSLIVNLIRKKRNEEINESKLRFFINISHEIRSPLTLIINPMEKLLKGDFDAKTMETLQVMHRNSNRILGLVNQLLDMRKIDKGQMKLRYDETDMVAFVKELFDVFEYQAAKRNINLTFQTKIEKLPVWIDRSNFDKILMNLLSNAFKYTPAGGEIIVSLQTGINNNTRGPLRNYFEICVIDSGMGIDEAEKDKIFERFYQGHKQDSFTTIGSGIGLNLTQRLVQLHSGSITAKNRKETKGSCFTIRIPLGKDHLKKEEIAGKEFAMQSKQNSFLINIDNKEKNVKRKTNYKILVVDDEEEIRDYLKQELKDTYKISTAVNGVEGFKIAVSELPDLIISDVMMPESDGFKFVNKLKSNSNVSHIPVILLTSKTEYEDRINGLEKGADSYITKPFNTEELLITISNLIDSRKTLKNKFSGAQDQTDKIKAIAFKSSDEILMERIMSNINDNIGNPEFNVEALASKIGISRTQLHRKLKELTGLSSGDFIRNIKLKQAGILLKEKKMNISQVAYAVGFTNQTHFSTTFKKFYGISPTDFILQCKDTEMDDEI